MKIAIRVDASDETGSGHLIRCLSLARLLRGQGAEVQFVCREHKGNLCSLVEQSGFDIARLPAHGAGLREAALDEDGGYSNWLGCRWQEDAEATVDAVAKGGIKLDCLVVDHYGIDWRWESALRSSTRRILVIDDLADRRHDCDLLLDQNEIADRDRRYSHLVPEGCGLLLGPRYALLDPGYADLHEKISPRSGQVGRILAFFGGADSHKLTERFLDAIRRPDMQHLQADVVLPFGSTTAASDADGRIRFHANLPTLAPLMAAADLCVGAGGVANWERLCLGLPTIVVAVAENQRAIAEQLHRLGLVRYLGFHDAVDAKTIAMALGQLPSGEVLADWSRRCLQVVDGKGCERVASVLTTAVHTPLQARKAAPPDEGLLLELANDPDTRRQAFSPFQIAADEHSRWFQAKLMDEHGCRFYIVEAARGIPIGCVRFQWEQDCWEIHFTLDRLYRGRGLGARLVATALERLASDLAGSFRVIGRVKESNSASCAVFASLGFTARADADPGTFLFERQM